MRKLKVLRSEERCGSIESMVTSMIAGEVEVTEETLKRVLDMGLDLDQELKTKTKYLKSIKEICLKFAEKMKLKELQGTRSIAKISSTTSATIDPKHYLQLLKDSGQKELFFDTVKVAKTQAKKYVGENALKEISVADTVEYGKISIKEKK